MNIISNSEYTDNFQTFLVTHSNHIINFSTHSSNSSIFTLNKVITKEYNSLPSFKLSNVSYGDTSILDLIGANKSSVFLSNCSIWVEGVTDKLYITKIMEQYCKSTKAKSRHKDLYNKLREGLHYIFVYSAGDNITHLNFEDTVLLDKISKNIPIKFLCGKAMVIIDDDNNKNPDRKNTLKNILKFDLNILNVIEIENILSPETILNTINEYPTINKLNLKIKPTISNIEYKSIKLGTYIDDHLMPALKKLNSLNSKTRTKSFKADKTSSNSTINGKVEFCEHALKHINSDNLTDEAVKVAQTIMDFVLRNNPNLGSSPSSSNK